MLHFVDSERPFLGIINGIEIIGSTNNETCKDFFERRLFSLGFLYDYIKNMSIALMWD